MDARPVLSFLRSKKSGLFFYFFGRAFAQESLIFFMGFQNVLTFFFDCKDFPLTGRVLSNLLVQESS